MRTLRLLALALAPAALALAPNAAAQNDDCSTPVPIAGAGVFVFDNSIASAGPQSPASGFCPTIGNDLWYRWTAPQTGVVTLATCGQVAHDSAVAVYAGSACPTPGTAITCDDDACGLESFISWTATGGSVYMLQIGSSGGGPGGPGTFTIAVQGVPSNDDCATPLSITGQLGAAYDNSVATNSAQGGGHGGCSTVTADLWFEWTAPQNGTATLETCGQSAMDTAVLVFVGAGCPTGAPIACDDDGCGVQSVTTWPIVAGVTYTIDVGCSPSGVGGPGSFTIQLAGSGSNGTPYCSGDGTATPCPCGNNGATGAGCSHSAGGSGLLAATGTASVASDSILLQGSGMTANSPALYYQGTTRLNAGTGLVFGDGLRCVGGSIVRLATRVNTAGASGYGAPAGDVPVSVRGLIPAAGGTRTYQAWYRNAASFCTASTFNLTNGVEIVWSP